ncbi:hypothetical protein D9M69_565020 [compost metagenome]
MGTDHHLRFARRHLCQYGRAGFAGDLAGQPRDAHAQGFEPRAQVDEVLLGQQLGRGRQRHLLAGFDCQHARQRGHHCLAAADVALYQPQHRRRLGDVLADLREHALLRTRQRERQRLDQRLHQRALPLQRGRTMLLQGQSLPTQAQVVGQQFFDRQPALRGVRAQCECSDIRIVRRAMHGQQGLPQ